MSQLYREAKTLHASMEEYTRTFRSQQDLALLKQALTGGQISMIEYFVEVSVLYQSHQNYLQLENQYQKAMARIQSLIHISEPTSQAELSSAGLCMKKK